MNYKLSILLFLIINCGNYSFKGSLPEGVKSVVIAPIVNNTSEYALTNLLNDNLNRELSNQNILDIVDIYSADTNLELIIESVKDNSNIYVSNEDLYENIKQWKLLVKVKINWYNINDNSIIVDRNIEDVLIKIKSKFSRPIYVGRAEAASPATGSLSRHLKEQDNIVKESLNLIKPNKKEIRAAE